MDHSVVLAVQLQCVGLEPMRGIHLRKRQEASSPELHMLRSGLLAVEAAGQEIGVGHRTVRAEQSLAGVGNEKQR